MRQEAELPQVETKTPEEALKSFIGECVGEASMLWTEPGPGAFESGKAIELADKIYNRIQNEIRDERTRVLTQVLRRQNHMVAEYRLLIKSTGGLLTNSMVYAYSKGINDTFKLIAKGDSQNVQKKD